MKRTRFNIFLILFLIVLTPLILAWTPTSDIDGRGIRALYNFTYLNATLIYMDGVLVATTSIADTNESTRFNALVATNCPGTLKQVGVNSSGGVECAVDIDTDTNETTRVDDLVLSNASVWTNITALLLSNTSQATAIGLRILISEEGNLNVNNSLTSDSTTLWASVSSFLSKWFYDDGDVFTLNETQLNSTIDDRVSAGRLQLFFYNETDPVNSTFTIMNSTIPAIGSTGVTVFTSMGDGDTTLAMRILTSIQLTLLQAGVYDQHATINYTAGTKTVHLRSMLYKRFANGTEVEIGSSPNSNALTSGTFQQVEWTGVIPSDTTFQTGDYLRMDLIAVVSGGGSAPTISLLVENGTAARLDISINPTDLIVSEANFWDSLDDPTDITALGTISSATSITSSAFVGPLTGNADTATTATTWASVSSFIGEWFYDNINVFTFNTTRLTTFIEAFGYSTTTGTVTTVSGTTPIVSSGGTTPAISITVLKDLVTTSPLSGGVNDILTGSDSDVTITISQADTSTDGYVSQADWNTFNNKADSDTTYSAGGLYQILSGTTFSVNETALNNTIIIITDARDGEGVTSVAAGNGLDFTTITTSGSVVMGTPSAVTGSSSNAVTSTSHTHSATTDDTGDCAAGVICGGGHSHSDKIDTSSESGLDVNSANFWDALNSPTDITSLGTISSATSITSTTFTDGTGTITGGDGTGWDDWNITALFATNGYFTTRVGIGTTNPGNLLEITGTGNQGLLINIEDNTALIDIKGKRGNAIDPVARISFYNKQGSDTEAARVEVLGLDAGGEEGQLVFHTADSGATLRERMRIDYNGNVGIGNTAPNATLHITGGACFDDDAICVDPGAGNVGVTGTITANSFVGPLTGTASIATLWASVSSFQATWFSDAANVFTFNEAFLNSTIDARDSDTTYTAGNGISVSSEVFTVAAGAGLDQEASGLKVEPDGITDTELAFNTGQALTTTSNPTFNNQTISNCLVFASGGKICSGI